MLLGPTTSVLLFITFVGVTFLFRLVTKLRMREANPPTAVLLLGCLFRRVVVLIEEDEGLLPDKDATEPFLL